MSEEISVQPESCLEKLSLRVGALMYTPASRVFTTGTSFDQYGGVLDSLAFCLEDTIRDEAVREAQEIVRGTLNAVCSGKLTVGKTLLFIRVRTPEHLQEIRHFLGESENVLSGYILPKFDLSNAEAYVHEIETWDTENGSNLFAMPILESAAVAEAGGRVRYLEELKTILGTVGPRILNLRVGGNDLCNLFGIRRGVRQTIYEIGPVLDVLSDIVNVFSRDYVISAPVWEYYGDDPTGPWAAGLRKEIEHDKLNGFIGKTAIHPAQLPVIHEGLKVSRSDYEDALRILRWKDEKLGVGASADGDRMNEVRCHATWARRIAQLGQIYGLLEEEE